MSQTAPTAGAAGRSQKPVLDNTGEVQSVSGSSISHAIAYLEDGVQENANWQVQWSNWMSDGKERSFYKHVSVLLLSWHPDCDDLKVDPEIKALKAVFEEPYNYHVETEQLDSRLSSLPQSQANRAVADFVYRNDKEDTLFIVYYAGHGGAGAEPGHIQLTGRRRQEGKRISQQLSHITWNEVETNLKTTRADVFLIFDCCHSSDLGRDSTLSSRSFEYLAASTTSWTPSPGEQSFTTALIWALKELASPQEISAGSPMFPTSKLAKKISECPGFPKTQIPSLLSRNTEAYQRIVLAPLPREGDSESTPARHSEGEDENEEEDEEERPSDLSLSLTFNFKHKQEESKLVKRLADHLKIFMKLESSLQKVQWGGIWRGVSPSARHRWNLVFRQIGMRSQGTSHVNSRHQDSMFAPGNTQGDGLLAPADERRPLLSGTSSVAFDDHRQPASLTFWTRIRSFFRNFGKSTSTEPQVQAAHAVPSVVGKTSNGWTHSWRGRLQQLFTRASPRVLI